MSSKPITEMSSGTRRPRLLTASIAPNAISSLAAKMAVGHDARARLGRHIAFAADGARRRDGGDAREPGDFTEFAGFAHEISEKHEV
jgi:hypothetical protein